MRVFHLIEPEYGFDDIFKSRIKVSRYSDLNDPFELLAVAMNERLLRRAVRFMRNEFISSVGIISFSRSWQNPVLWSHYADKHKGLALGFDIPDQYAIPIKYSEKRIQVRFIDNDPSYGIEQSFADEMLHTKYSHWSYENEVRMIEALKDCEKEGQLYFKAFGPELELKEVILGHNFSGNKLAIEKALKERYPGAFVIQARLAFKTFGVVPDQRSVRRSSNQEATRRYDTNFS